MTAFGWCLILGMLDDETGGWFEGLDEDDAPKVKRTRRVSLVQTTCIRRG